VATEARGFFADDPLVDELDGLGRAALPLLRQAEDHAGLARVWSALGFGVANVRGRYEEVAEAAELAHRHSELAGQTRVSPFGLPFALVYGPRPADEALQALDAVLSSNAPPPALIMRAELLAMLGRFEEAWAVALSASERQRELSDFDGDCFVAEIAVLAGDHATAVDQLCRVCRSLQQQGNRALLSTSAPALGRALCALGRYEEAEPQAQLGRELGEEQDFATQVMWRRVQALVDSHRGKYAEAERLAREAVEIAEGTDALNVQADAFCDLAEVLDAAGRGDEAVSVLEQALDRYERKKNLVMAERIRARLIELQPA
jgi:tetratricopeptide (TPR) repeat protein